ncbi:MAG: hypothetical protein R6V06_09700, partial [Kiritimatiellia bacterium]
ATSLFVGPNNAGAAYSVYAPTSSDGDTLLVTLYNDAIEEAEFIGSGRNISLSNTVVTFDDTYTPPNNSRGTYATMLDGQFAKSWDASWQTAKIRDAYLYPTNCLLSIPVMGNFVQKDGYGPVFRLYKSYYNKGLNIKSPFFEIINTGERTPLLFYQNGGEKTGWAACNSMDFVELRPEKAVRIEEGADLKLLLDIRISSYKTDCMTGHTMKNPLLPGAWAYLRKPGSTETNDFVSMDATILSNNFNLVRLDTLPILESMAVGYADEGEYVSHPYDTQSYNKPGKTIEWDADIPDNTELKMYTRSGDTLSDNGFNIADAASWENISPQANGGVINGSGRYVQFRTFMKSLPWSAFPGESGGNDEGPFRSTTPKLNKVFMQWDGEEKYVDVVGTLMKGPDCGRFKVEVDGKPMIRGVTMEIEIFKDIATMGNKKERLRSTMMAEVEPRNSKND